MLHVIDKRAHSDSVHYTRPAVLTGQTNDELLVRVEHQQASFVIAAKNALADYQPQIGDEVLVSSENFRCCYIIGILNLKDKTSAQDLSTGSGVVARRHNKHGYETLSIIDEQGHLLFEYDVTEKKSKLYAAQGDLSLTALEGDIELISGKNIQCNSLGGIMMQSATAAQIRVASEVSDSSVNLSDQGMLLSSNSIGVKATNGKLEIDHGQLEGKTFRAVLDRSKILVGKIETVAIRIIERAKNVYRHVDELQQTRANRVRTLVEGSYQLNSETSYIKSEKNVNIDGERIHLG